VAVALLAVLALLSSAIAVVATLEVRRARQEIAELRDQAMPSDIRAEALEAALRGLTEEVFEGQPGLLEDLGSCFSGGVPAEGGPPAGLRDQIDYLTTTVEELRGLAFDRAPHVTVAPPVRVQEVFEDLFLRGFDEDAADLRRRILATLGAAPPGLDLREAQRTLLRVGGFYVPQTGRLYVRETGDGLGRYGRLSLVHELEHALADQALGLPTSSPAPGEGDRARAASAVVEGDAVLTTQRYVLTLPLHEQVLLAGPSLLSTLEPGTTGLPHFLDQERAFPYLYGLPFVCALYTEGGWDAVDRAYHRPPTTTAEILFPERYLNGEDPVDPQPVGQLPGPWRLETVEQFGAADLLWLFEAPGDDPSRALANPLAPLDDWGGGELRLWTRGSLSAVGISIAERPSTVRSDLCFAVADWYQAAFPGADEVDGPLEEDLTMDGARQDAVVTCAGPEVRIGMAPTLSLARTLVD
jgi:hypothetical protein